MSGRRIVFLNLLIDQLWAEHSLEKIFPVRSPVNVGLARAMDQLGQFFCEPGDMLVCSAPAEPGLHDLLAAKGAVPTALRRIVAGSSPGSEEWKQELAGIPELRSATGAFFSATSSVEAWLAATFLGSKPAIPEELFRRLNDKRYLTALAPRLGLAFPETHLLGAGDPALDGGRWLFKAAVSAGGSGIVAGRGDWKTQLAYLRRMGEASGAEMAWLAQRELERRGDYYTLAEVDASGTATVTAQFELEYGESFSSTAHRWLKEGSAPAALGEAALKLGAELAKEGYRGSFGLDGFLAADGQVYPVIDLNVRVDKCRAILQACLRLGRAPGGAVCRRSRIPAPPGGFAALWPRWMRAASLGADGGGAEEDFCFPLAWAAVGGIVDLYWLANPDGAEAAGAALAAALRGDA